MTSLPSAMSHVSKGAIGQHFFSKLSDPLSRKSHHKIYITGNKRGTIKRNTSLTIVYRHKPGVSIKFEVGNQFEKSRRWY